jgi:hypothetical protein
MSETVEVKVNLPKRTFWGLEWYVMQTSFWLDNDHLEQSLSDYVAYIIREWLGMEADEPKDARDFITQELKQILQ